MTATDRFNSLDETVKSIREEHERALKASQDELLAAHIEVAMLKDAIKSANTDRDKWMRIATKLTTQFGTVEAVFADAKRMALSIEEEKKAQANSQEKVAVAA